MPKEAPSITSTLASLASLSSTRSPAPLKIHFPTTNTTVSSPGVHLTKEATSPSPIYSISASALSHLTFPNCDLSPSTSASTESSLSSASASTSALQSGQASASAGRRRSSGISLRPDPAQLHSQPRYMVVALDLDAPFPSVPLMAPLLHGVQADLVLSTDEIDEGEEYIPLEVASLDSAEGYGECVNHVVDYIGPSPPPTSSPHRYMFMLWEQPRGLTRARIAEEVKLGNGYGHGDHMGIKGRARWDQEGFEKRLGLERVVGGNYFVC
ncbi:phosphatidylethanolamine-binding protein [Rhypophila decipiens]|uniref:Phosphatidylethanolamine-binding protein n=1 Tax=Rhypophila decipiens TaxID=261697 RepID=A0AAN6Y5G5_9PEZI|nr:phosphatidylethanolamine-binding protein [Rhypophila decipiens]